MDQRARESFKTTIELQLDENISHTSNMCQQAVRKLILSLLKVVNKSKQVTFGEATDIKILKFNQLIGSLIAEEFSEFLKLPQEFIEFEKFANT